MSEPQRSRSIDLNSDIGESFGRWTLGDDEAMLGLVSSANIACGFHAGDPLGMQRTARIAVQRGVVIGAHVGYRDLAGFGRRTLDVASDELRAEIVYQIGALAAIAASVGGRVAYVKPHGALYNTIVRDERQALDVVEAIRQSDASLPILGLPGAAVLRIAEAEGMTIVHETFADRGYLPDGTLAPRGSEGAVLHDAELVAERMRTLVTKGTLQAIDGTEISLTADSICVHGDSPGAVAMASAVRAALDGADVTVRPFAEASA